MAGGGLYSPAPHDWQWDIDLNLPCSQLTAQALKVAEWAHAAGLRVVLMQRTVNGDAERQQDERAKRSHQRTHGTPEEPQPRVSRRGRALAAANQLQVKSTIIS
jgi:hypothetical protein